jgi:two-component system, NarL family, nitrate/nitrite response regulator NarL
LPSVAVLAARTLARAGLVGLLRSLGFDQVEDADTLDDLMQRTNGTPPEILLAELPSNAAGVGDLMETIRAWSPTTKVVLLSAHFDIQLLSESFALGATGYLLDNLSAEALEKNLTLVSAGEKVFPSELALVLSHGDKRGAASGLSELRGYELSAQEIAILRLLTDGRSNKAIAAIINIAESTAKLHLRNILHKLGATNRTQAALWAMRRGIAVESDNPLAADGTLDD